VYCSDEHLSISDIQEATQAYAVFAALALTRGQTAPARGTALSAHDL
jgi:hypothetical protein